MTQRRQKAAMDNVARLNQARHRVMKVQRRIWLLQAAFWPAMVLSVTGVAVLSARWVQRRQHVSTASAPPTRSPADDAQAS